MAECLKWPRLYSARKGEPSEVYSWFSVLKMITWVPIRKRGKGAVAMKMSPQICCRQHTHCPAQLVGPCGPHTAVLGPGTCVLAVPNLWLGVLTQTHAHGTWDTSDFGLRTPQQPGHNFTRTATAARPLLCHPLLSSSQTCRAVWSRTEHPASSP